MRYYIAAGTTIQRYTWDDKETLVTTKAVLYDEADLTWTKDGYLFFAVPPCARPFYGIIVAQKDVLRVVL